MKAARSSSSIERERPAVEVRIRIYDGDEPALGPGRAELLGRIREMDSIAQAARDMGMSYMKAWKLIQSMNRCFREPLVDVRRGGKAGGIARLTALGEKALALYQQIERESRQGSAASGGELSQLLRSAVGGSSRE